PRAAHIATLNRPWGWGRPAAARARRCYATTLTAARVCHTMLDGAARHERVLALRRRDRAVPRRGRARLARPPGWLPVGGRPRVRRASSPGAAGAVRLPSARPPG